MKNFFEKYIEMPTAFTAAFFVIVCVVIFISAQRFFNKFFSSEKGEKGDRDE